MSLLFSPIDIGSLTLPNRIVMPAMHLNFTMDGMVNEKLIAFYRRRAQGGCGLFQIGGCTVDEDAGAEFMIGINDDKYIDGLGKLAESIHAEGAKCGLQLYHAGRYTYSFFLGGKLAPSASATMSGLTREMSREMTIDEIQHTINDFAVCAARVKQAGFDVVEIIASAGYLVNQFFSPLTNQRTDQYGGSSENRMRFGVEVIEAVRNAVGPDFPITVRLSGHDFVPDSNTNKENAQFALRLQQAGAQMFNVTGGWHESRVPQITNALPRGGYAYLARNVKRLVDVPVAAANRINKPEVAEQLLAEGWCDMVSLGRSLITDPDWPIKAKEGRPEDILNCISCNQECLDNIFQMKQLGCLMNPIVGRDEEPEAPMCDSKKVLVVGGGPAGLSAAATLARRGHSVTLVEKENRVGGQIYAASVAPNKDEFATIPGTLAHQAKLAGAEIETGIEMTEEEVRKRNPDMLVIATGSSMIHPPIPGADSPNVVDAMDALEGRALIGDNVVVIGGGPIGVETALHCAEIGTLSSDMAAFLLKHDAEDPDTIRDMLWRGNKTVTIIEQLPKIGGGIGKSTKWIALKEMQAMKIRMIPNSKATAIDEDCVKIQSDDGEQKIKADTVILAVGVAPNDPLKGIADNFDGEVVYVGDVAKIGDAATAIRDGYEKTKQL